MMMRRKICAMEGLQREENPVEHRGYEAAWRSEGWIGDMRGLNLGLGGLNQGHERVNLVINRG